MVPAIDDIRHRFDPLAGFERDAQQTLAVDMRDEFTLPEIVERFGAPFLCDAEGDTHAGPTAVEPQYEAWTLRRSAMDVRAHAQSAPESVQPRLDRDLVLEARSPHQRPVAEHPKIAHIGKPYPPRPQPCGRAALSGRAS
jgi:hypothetical protein